jgi:hypothetical protein
VNNAGIVASGPLLYLKPSEPRRQLEVSMSSPLIVIQAFAPLLATDKKGRGSPGRFKVLDSSDPASEEEVDVCNFEQT